jgi:hypothetical protein
MNSKTLRFGKSLFFSAASAGERALAVFVVLCILANSLVPRFSIGAKDYSMLCRIMKSESVIFEFFSFSNIPVKIVNELMSRRGGMQPLAPKKAPKDDTKNTSNTSSDFSITSSNLKDASARFSSQPGSNFNGNAAAVFRENLSGLPGSNASGAPPWACFAFLIILMFYFLRARSALPDAYAISMFFNTLNPAFSFSRVFYLPLKIYETYESLVNSRARIIV